MIVQTRQYKNDPPPGIQDRITRAGGRNIYGDPNFRLTWGPSGEELLVGFAKWEKVPKYLDERWMIEMWQPPRETPEEWERITHEYVKGVRVDRMGPYPYRGTYEHLATIEGSRGQFLQITPAMADLAIQLVHRARALVGSKTREQRKNEKFDEKEKEKQEWHNVIDDAIDDRALPFGGSPWSSVNFQKPRHKSG